MSDNIPPSILRTWPDVPTDRWERLSEHRYQAPHNLDGFVHCVVSVFGETLGRSAKSGDEASVFAELFEHAANVAAHHQACANGTPMLRPNIPVNYGVVGRCWWCGKWPGEHQAESTAKVDLNETRHAGAAPEVGGQR